MDVLSPHALPAPDAKRKPQRAVRSGRVTGARSNSRRGLASQRLRGGLCALASSLLFVGSAQALDDGYTYDLAAELMSPYCPGRTVASCPSPQASELVQWISVQEAGGATKDEVVEMLIERFGEEILGAPPAEGITLWAYVFPVAGFLGGGGAVWLVLRRIVGRRDDDDDDDDPGPSADAAPTSTVAPTAPVPPAESAEGPEASDDELARLVDQELANRR